jgi:hypothetical protein
MLGQHVIELLPNLFGSATLDAMMNIDNLSQFSFKGIIEHCLLDDFCRGYIGGNLKETFPKMVVDISNPNFNKCAEHLHKALKVPPGKSQGWRVAQLGWMLQNYSVPDARIKAYQMPELQRTRCQKYPAPSQGYPSLQQSQRIQGAAV